MSPALDPAARSAGARYAALKRHAKTDGRAATAKARHASHVERFEKLVDPEGLLAPAERSRRAAIERRAYFLQLAKLSAQARKNKAGS